MNYPKVENMESLRTGRAVANQFRVYTNDGVYFQSYSRTIVFKRRNGPTLLDENYWDYSNTTGKYRNDFLGEGIKETRKKLEMGTYILADLNK